MNPNGATGGLLRIAGVDVVAANDAQQNVDAAINRAGIDELNLSMKIKLRVIKPDLDRNAEVLGITLDHHVINLLVFDVGETRRLDVLDKRVRRRNAEIQQNTRIGHDHLHE